MRTTMCRHRSERGATLVLMAITILITLGMAAIAIDYGMIKAAKAEAQRAMDSAALAGASAFQISDPDSPDSTIAVARARELAKTHAVRNVPVTDPEVEVVVDLAKEEVTAIWQRESIGLWFASIFGSSSMGLTARATAHAALAGTTNCVKPVAIADIWDNQNNSMTDGGITYVEDENDNGVWDYVDRNTDGVIDPGEMEPWTFNTGDVYDPPSTGYGTTFRNGLGSGDVNKLRDYGRQLLLQALDARLDARVESYFHTWADNEYTRGTDSIAAGIRGERCLEASVGTEYRQGQGGKIPLGVAWEDLINKDPDAYWDDATNTVVESEAQENWLKASDRVVVVGLYDPALASLPSDNMIKFVNFAKLWIDQRPCSGETAGGQCKNPITARFLGYVEGGSGGPETGTLIKKLVLIR